MTGGIRSIFPWIDGVGMAFGTTTGVAVLIDPLEYDTGGASNWRLLTGDRWLGFSDVLTISAYNSSLIAVANNATMVAVISAPPDESLAGKATAILSTYPRHVLWNGLLSPVSLAAPGDILSPVPYSSDNGGLYAGYNVATQAFRYAATGDPEARNASLTAFAAIRQLVDVTGIPGVPGRSIASPTDTVDPADTRWGWNPSPVPEYNGWWFKGNTSSDEIVGHMMAYPLFHDLVAATSAEKSSALELATTIVSNIIDNDFKLVDANGEPTLFGFWDPETINDDDNHSLERGPYSVQILSTLLAAHRICAEYVDNPTYVDLRAKFAEAFDFLAFENGYAHNMVNQLVASADEINYSDIELSFLPYYTMSHACRPAASSTPDYREAEEETRAMCAVLAPWARESIERTYGTVAHQHSALWDLIYGAFTSRSLGPGYHFERPRNQDWKESGVATLMDYPEDLVRWSVDNTNRADLFSDTNLLPWKNQSITRIRRSESGALEWCNNPFLFSDGAEGLSEENPAFFLITYWLGRFHGFITAEL